jgi:hypothetical protein
MARLPSCAERCRRHGRYGLDIDFEKFIVAHGDAANLCNEFDAVYLRRRHRRPERYGRDGVPARSRS